MKNGPPPNMLSSSGIVPLNHDELKELRDTFKLFDKDGSDSIDCKELATVWRSMGQNPTEEELDYMMKMVDKDITGTLSWDEFYILLGANLIKPKANLQEELREAFSFFDKDGNGYIDSQELINAMTAFGDPLSETEALEMIRMVDTDGDGRLNYEEFIEGFTTRVEQAIENNDTEMASGDLE